MGFWEQTGERCLTNKPHNEHNVPLDLISLTVSDWLWHLSPIPSHVHLAKWDSFWNELGCSLWSDFTLCICPFRFAVETRCYATETDNKDSVEMNEHWILTLICLLRVFSRRTAARCGGVALYWWTLYYACSQKPLLFLSGGVTVLWASLRAETRLSPLLPALAVCFLQASSYRTIGQRYKMCLRSILGQTPWKTTTPSEHVLIRKSSRAHWKNYIVLWTYKKKNHNNLLQPNLLVVLKLYTFYKLHS